MESKIEEQKQAFEDPRSIISYLCSKSNRLELLYNSQVRHYKLETHTLLVCKQFELYFGEMNIGFNKDLFRFFLALHDIGKPIANSKGNRNEQYYFTTKIIKEVFPQLAFSQEDLPIVLALASGDYIGDFFQGKCNLEETKARLLKLTKSITLSRNIFFKLLMIYYQCDTSAYTADGGGLKHLEHLFIYKDGQKLFDENERLIKMAPIYWDKYLQLKTVF